MSKTDYLPYKAVFMGCFCMAEKERKVLPATSTVQCSVLGSCAVVPCSCWAIPAPSTGHDREQLGGLAAVLPCLSSLQKMSSQLGQCVLHTCGVLHTATLCFNSKGKNKTLDAPSVSGKVQKLLAVSVKFSPLDSWNKIKIF